MTVGYVSLIPTGGEVASGVIVDTDSPAIMQLALERWPGCLVKRLPPESDDEGMIASSIRNEVGLGSQLVIVIGGSGGGHAFAATLAPDVSHRGIKQVFPDASAAEIWGSNGHLFCEMLAARHDAGWVINVPGPLPEAVAACKAAMDAIVGGVEPEQIVQRMADAVVAQYPGAAASVGSAGPVEPMGPVEPVTE